MDLRALFAETGNQLLSEFRKAEQANHMGGRGMLREDAFAKFLAEHLPARYRVGRGEIVSAQNRRSGQMDVIIHDPDRCPALLRSPSHGLFPIESVFGAVSIKSDLTATELADAYDNVASAKRIVDQRPFRQRATGMSVGLNAPHPVCIVFAYRSTRSLDAIAKQAVQLDASLDSSRHRPDFIVVLERGIVGPRSKLRSASNAYALPQKPERWVSIRKTGRHTLLRCYLQLLDELNEVILRELDLSAYLKMPERIGDHLVSRVAFGRRRLSDESVHPTVVRISASGVQKILSFCEGREPVSREQSLRNQFHDTSLVGCSAEFLKAQVHEFNPRELPPLKSSDVRLEHGRATTPEDRFHAYEIRIDGTLYAVDLGALDEGDYEVRTDLDAEELFAE